MNRDSELGDTNINKQLHLLFVSCVIICGCESNNLPEPEGSFYASAETGSIEQIINNIKPYDNIYQVTEKLHEDFFNSHNPAI